MTPLTSAQRAALLEAQKKATLAPYEIVEEREQEDLVLLGIRGVEEASDGRLYPCHCRCAPASEGETR